MALTIPPLDLTPEQEAVIERERANHAAQYPGTDKTVAADAASFCAYLLTAMIDDRVREAREACLDECLADPDKRAKLIEAARTLSADGVASAVAVKK